MGLFRRKKDRPLFIHMKKLIDIIEDDYREGYEFNLVEICFKEKLYILGSEMDSNDECLYLVFEENDFTSMDDFKANIVIDNENLYNNDVVVEVKRACIIGGDSAISSPWCCSSN